MVHAFIVLTEIVEKEDDQFVSTCPELGTASCGDTIEEAFANLEEAIEVHLSALEETGERDRFFSERGIKLHSPGPTEPVHRPIPFGTVIKATTHRVPVPA